MCREIKSTSFSDDDVIRSYASHHPSQVCQRGHSLHIGCASAQCLRRDQALTRVFRHFSTACRLAKIMKTG